MIGECHVYIVDPQKRDLNLSEITKKIKNWHSFGEWNNGKCYGGWNMLNHNKILYILSKYDLYIMSYTDINAEPKKIIYEGNESDEYCIII